MTLRKAAEHFEQALAIAQAKHDKAVEEQLAAGLVELTSCLQRDLHDMDNKLRELERLIRRLD